MRYMIRFEVTAAAGEKIDRSAGPGQAIGKLLELLKPEAFYVSVFKRELFIVVDNNDPAVLGEAAHIIQLIGGTSPEVTPVMSGEETMRVLPAAIQNAVNTVKGLGL
jgi:hypothetical protein